MADSYVVLARRYRSATFDELVGQEPIARTLKNAIKSNRVAHAFLFTGTRGVEKTSAARILAKAINCPNRTADGNPCGECNSCKAIARGDDLDVIEIDGASNRGIDNIRELRQAAGVRPARSPFKIYIIDEVHMVTKDAFNALLKTLEEPPSHVKFIFATTEIDKVPATILSRCQRFDFKPIPLARIAEHLQHVLQGEHVKADQEALFRIARLGAGSMRDALSLLDRVLSFGEKHVTEKMLEELLGKPQGAAVVQLVTALSNGDAAAAITQADTLLKEGMGVEQLLSELIEFFRNLLLVAACGEKTELLDVPAESRGIYVGLAGKYDAPALVHQIALCEQALRSLRGSIMQRPLFDALIVRLALAEQFSNLRELLAGGRAAHPDGDALKKKSDGELRTANDAEPQQSRDREGAVSDSGAEAVAESIPANAGEPEAEESIYDTMKAHLRAKKEQIDVQNQQRGPLAGRPMNGNGAAAGGRASGTIASNGQPAAVEKFTDLADLPGLWEATRRHLSGYAGILESVLGPVGQLTVMDQAAQEITLALPQSQRNFTNDKAKARLEEALRAVSGLPLKLRVEFVEGLGAGPGARGQGSGESMIGVVPQHPIAAAQRIPPELHAAIQNQPLIRELAKRLDATITQIEILPSAGQSPGE